MKNPNQTSFSLLLIAAIATILCISCCKEHRKDCGDLTSEEIAITQNIQGIIIEGPWQVTVTQDSVENSAFLEYSIREQQRVTTQLLPNGYLHIKISSWGSTHYNCEYRATIRATTLETIEGSGATIIRTFGHFADLQKITLSGASTVNGLSGDGTSANIKLSGASTLKSFTFEGYDIDAELSGASNATFDNVTLDYCTVDCSGASKFKGSGYADKTSFKGSGASDLKTLSMESENLDIDLSGASIAEVKVNDAIKGRLSGASTLKYKRGADVSGVHTSGGSNLVVLD